MPIPTTPLMTTPHPHSSGKAEAPASDLPSVPTGLQAAIVATRFVTLSWQMPERTGSTPIIAYSVYWKEVRSDRYVIVA